MKEREKENPENPKLAGGAKKRAKMKIPGKTNLIRFQGYKVGK